MLNGALIAAGVSAVVDNVLAHWLLGLHRVAPDRGHTAALVLGGGAAVCHVRT